jgi:hypothetical protein
LQNRSGGDDSVLIHYEWFQMNNIHSIIDRLNPDLRKYRSVKKRILQDDTRRRQVDLLACDNNHVCQPCGQQNIVLKIKINPRHDND